jgi:hypothetical protein
MAAQTVQDVIRKAVIDDGFRTLLLNKPAEALVGYDLTDDERQNLSNLDSSLFEGGADDLGERLSRVARGGWDGN